MSDFPIVPAATHITRQVLSDHPELMVVAFRFEADGAIGAAIYSAADDGDDVVRPQVAAL